jgi:hypothetical protein
MAGTYEGQFSCGVFSGRGTFKWKEGHVYIGQWENGKRHGQGKFRTCPGHNEAGGRHI